MSKRTLQNMFFTKRLKIKQNTEKNEADIDELWFQVEVHFFQSDKKKTSVQVSAVPKLTVSF